MKTMKRKGPGRPRLMANTKRIIVQIDDAQLKAIQEIRRDKNISVSQFLRTAAEYYLTHAYNNN